MKRLTPEQESLERPVTAAGQLLVEGRVPEIFFRELVCSCGLVSEIEVRTFGEITKSKLQTYLELFTQKALFKKLVRRLGIVRDAEASNAPSALQSVQAALLGAQLPAPTEMQMFEGDPLAVGVFILPNGQDSGMLEDLCLTAVAEMEQKSPVGLLPCVSAFLSCLEKQGRSPANPSKARFAAYALACDVIDPQLGRAAQQGAIPWKAAAFDTLKAFLTSLAGR